MRGLPRSARLSIVSALLILTAAGGGAAVCVGDCNGNGEVTVDELITGVNIALGSGLLSACLAFDASLDGTVTVDELIVGVNNALNGCPKPPARLDVWRPTTVPWDPECRVGCMEVSHTASLAHAQAELRIRLNPAVDDPIAQWGDCLESVLACFERDGTLTPCVEQSACPAECKSLFGARAGGAVDDDARVSAFEAVFVDRAAPCRPADEVAP